MVATLLSLKLRLTVAELKRSTARLVIWAIVGVYCLAMVVLALVGLVAASPSVAGNEAQVGALTVVAGSLVVLGWVLLPLVFFGSDQTLDPARFTQFPLRGRQLAPGLAVSGIVGVPGFLTALAALGSALPWLHRPLVLLVGLVGGALGWFICQIGCRAASAGLAGLLTSRRAKDMTGLIGVVVVLVLVVIVYCGALIAGFFSEDPTRWSQLLVWSRRAGDVLAWTPLGAPWALVGDAGQGHWGLLAGHLLVGLVCLGLLMWGFSVVLDRALVTPPHSQTSAAAQKGDSVARAAGWFWARGSARPVAAIVARCLRYWRRDPRYASQIPAILVMPILFTIISRSFTGFSADSDQSMPAFIGPAFVAFGLGLMAIMAGYAALSADVASDASAWWLHLATGVRGWQDRAGRALADMAWAIPLVVVATILVMAFTSDPSRMPAAVGATLSLYLAAVAVSSVFSALIIYPVALPGESPMRTRTAMLGSQMLSQMGCLLVSGLLGLPVCLWAVFSRGWQGWLVLVVGLVWGLALVVVGLVVGGRVMDSRGPAILASLMKNDSRERG